MNKLNRREFISLLLKSSTITGMSALSTGILIKENMLSKSATAGYPLLGQFPATVIQNDNQYIAYDIGGNVLFQGSCSDGSGTCGIYEAVNYVQQNYGFGKVGLVGSFYPINSPSGSFNVELDGSAIVYLNPGSIPFMLSLQKSKSVKYLWYKNVGIINQILSKKQSFSLEPYVLLQQTPDGMFLGDNDQYLGTPSTFTVSAWVNGFGSGDNSSGFIISYGYTNSGASWAIRQLGNTVFVTLQNGSNVLHGSGPTSVPWHVALVYNNGNSELYVNGKLVDSGSFTIDYVNPSYLWIGNFPIVSQQGGLNPANAPYAWIENIQVYNSALSSTQVATLASSPTQDPVNYSTLISWSLYRYILFVGDLITGKGFQRMYVFSESGVF